MGYRSDVRIRLKTKDYENLVEEYTKKFPEDNEVFGKYLDVHIEQKDVPCYDLGKDGNIIIKKEDCVFFGWNDYKWYEAFDEVQFIMDFIRKCKFYAFCRIGESFEGDIDSFSEGMDMIGFYHKFDEEEE